MSLSCKANCSSLRTRTLMQEDLAKTAQKVPEIKPGSTFLVVKVTVHAPHKAKATMSPPLPYFTVNIFELVIAFCSTLRVTQRNADNCLGILTWINTSMEIKGLT